MENEVKRCIACGKEIPKASKACYCNNKCYMAAYYRKHNPRKELSGECLCYYNIEVLCTDRQCENCGWNPIVEQRRRDMLVRAEAEKETVSKEAFKMRLIDSDALDDKLEALVQKYTAQGRSEVAKDYSFVQTVLLTAPTVDAVAVVRCKDCIYATAQDGDLYCDGPIGIFGTVGANDFCSCGERREGE